MSDRPYYEKQVRLLLRCLPEIARQPCFALKGGTAINLFVRDFPRLSVDIDLTYLPLKPRAEALQGIGDGLIAIKHDIEKLVGVSKVQEQRPKEKDGREHKLQVVGKEAIIKIEVNTVLRGAVHAPRRLDLVPSAQEHFQVFVTTSLLSDPDLYGGKLCAALDRQHPRDLFDVKLLLEASGITSEIRRAFVVYLASHNRPMEELLKPRPPDIHKLYDEQFDGMARVETSLDDLLHVRDKIGTCLRESLDADEKRFLLSMKEGSPEWDLLGIEHLDKLPALQWKLKNNKKMAPSKRSEQVQRLREVLDL